MTNKIAWIGCLLAGASVVALSPAAAQQGGAAQPAEKGVAAAADTTADSAEPAEMVVTGSRLLRSGTISPTPLTVVGTADLQQTTPSTLADGLYKLPVFATLPAQTRNPGNSSGNSGANALNLRSIGAERTLVLFNGLRLPVNNIDQIPQMLISRVDIVTGGASAVYGSDAVAGVVNFIVDKKFEGLKVNGALGISNYGDDFTQRIGAAYGKTFGKLHVMGSAEYYNDPGVLSKLARPWGREVWSTQGAGTAANPFREVINTRISNTSFGGKILASSPGQPTNPLLNQNFTQNGILSPFVNGTATGASTIQSGGDGAYFNQASFKTRLRNLQLFGRADYELTDNVTLWAQGTYVDTNNLNNHQNNEFRSYTISADNAFLAPAYQQTLRNAGVGSFLFGKMMTNSSPLQPETFLKTSIFSAGIDAKLNLFGSEWNASFGGQISREGQRTSNNANMDGAKAAAALDAVVNPANGQVVCRVTLTNPVAFPGCVPLNVFGPTSESQAALNYILLKTSFYRVSTLKSVVASITGSPFSTWAGPVQLAVSGEARQAAVTVYSDYQPSDRVNCSQLPVNPLTGKVMNCSTDAQGNSTQARWVSNVVAQIGRQAVSVKEIAVETDIPLLKDAFLAQSLSVNAAARYTDYSSSGGVWTWKVGGDWRLNDSIRLRATRSRDILAPSVTQLYGAVAVNPSGITDLHTGVNAVAPVQTSPNPNLVPEVANTLTAGIVLTPSFLPSLTLSVDYYRIKIDNAIATVTGNNATVARLCEDSNGTSPLCSLYIRPLPFSDRTAANFPTLILAQPRNIAAFRSEGIDTEVNYRFGLGQGMVNLRGLVTYTIKQTTQTLPGTTVLDAAGAAGLPGVRATLNIQYAIGNFRFDLLQRYVNATRRDPDPNQVWAEPNVPAKTYTDITLSYDIKALGGNNQVYFNVQNLFNVAPAVYGTTGGSASVPGLFLATTNGHDIMGRYMTVGFRSRF
ncbi:MAG: TonB-dependent receptor [Sphingomonadales bacterium]|jgi:outer membrane receptor protein involved in Fe transport